MATFPHGINFNNTMTMLNQYLQSLQEQKRLDMMNEEKRKREEQLDNDINTYLGGLNNGQMSPARTGISSPPPTPTVPMSPLMNYPQALEAQRNTGWTPSLPSPATPGFAGGQIPQAYPGLVGNAPGDPYSLERLMPFLKSGNESVLNFLLNKQKMEEPDWKTAYDTQSNTWSRYNPNQNRVDVAPTGLPEMQVSGRLPEGFTQITNPQRKAEIWNAKYGTNYSAKDFESVQERPYYTTQMDRDGKLRVFDARSGKFLPETGDEVVKSAPTEIKTSISNFNDNLNTVKEIRKITNIGDLTGVVRGRTKQIGRRFYSDVQATTLANRLAQLRTIIYGLSGKQINEQEQKWLNDEVLPQMRQPTENFEVTLDEFEKWIKRKKSSIIQQFPNIKDDVGNTKRKLTGAEIDAMSKEEFERREKDNDWETE